MHEIDYLNHHYGIPGQILFKEGAGGLAMAQLSNEKADAAVVLQGGHLINWTPRGGRPVIWLSRAAKFGPGKSIRGGIPVCWPWFGPHSGEGSFPAHGFARTAPWNVIAAGAAAGGDTYLELRLADHEANRAQWPYPSELTMRITAGAALEIDLVTRNAGDIPFTIGEALHTYFAVGDVRETAVHGLAGCEYLDKADGGGRRRQAGAVTFAAEIDRVYVDTAADCFIDDPSLGRRIRIGKHGSRSTVVWNPWHEKAAKMGDLGDEGYLKMVCVESANAADNLVTIAAGGEHRLAVSYQVEPLPVLRS